MSDFKTKMHQIRFRLGSAPDPAQGAYSAPPEPLAGFGDPILLRSGEGKGRAEKGRKRWEGEGKEREGA